MEQFKNLFLNATNNTMKYVFGQSAEIIYEIIEEKFRIKREEISEKTSEFYSHLEKLIGSEGARVIQNTSLRCLCLKLQEEYEEVEEHLLILDELYKKKFELLFPSQNKHDLMRSGMSN